MTIRHQFKPILNMTLEYFSASDIEETERWEFKFPENQRVSKNVLHGMMVGAARNGVFSGVTVMVYSSFSNKSDLGGYCLFTRGNPDLRIDRIAVKPMFHRCGIGRFMISSLMQMIEDPNKPNHPTFTKFRTPMRGVAPAKRKSLRNSLEISVDEYNTPAHLFLQKVGFSAFGVEDGKYKFIRFAE